MSFFQTLGLATAFVITPVILLLALATRTEANRFHWLLKAAYTGAFVGMMWLIAPWHWISHYLRWLWIALFVLALAVSHRRHRGVRFRLEGSMRTWSDGIALAVFLAIGGYAATGLWVSDPAVELEFPLRDGVYVVGQGGNNPLVNYHNVHPEQRYALDILAVDAWGRRAAGWSPADLDRYVIYGQPLYSPCDGVVVRAVNDLPDLAPPDADREHPAGNHVVIRCQGVDVVLAHMQQGSVSVREGDAVKAGDRIGAVGNSGNTTEPHLHIHAVATTLDRVPGDATEATASGAGVPIRFDGRFLARNALIRR